MNASKQALDALAQAESEMARWEARIEAWHPSEGRDRLAHLEEELERAERKRDRLWWAVRGVDRP